MKPLYNKKEQSYVVAEGDFKGYHYYIVSHKGNHPCAYVENKTDITDMMDSRLYELDVHGGITYVGGFKFFNPNDDKIYFGWDYGHCDDFIQYPDKILKVFREDNIEPSQDGHKYTFDEVKKDVKSVINQMCKLLKDKDILDSTERKYLRNMLLPIENSRRVLIESVRKIPVTNKITDSVSELTDLEQLVINYTYAHPFNYVVGCTSLPPFEKNTQYKNMKLGKAYGLLELGL